MSEDLVQWLGEQLDEGQRLAEDALKRTTTTRRRIGGEWVEDTVQPPEWRRSVWGPARVLREIEAQRQTLAELGAADRAMDEASRDRDTARYNAARAERQVLKRIVHRDAAVYADQPGYREEWRP